MLDAAIVDELKELLGEDVGEVFDVYLDDSPKRLAEMRQCVRSGDAESLWKAAHTLKGSSRNVGASALADLCADLEVAARQGFPADAEARVDAIESAFAEVAAEIKVLLKAG
jgi:HPt (histidine-containing phosphotransfer) domain-containing protein